jgi:hypothetical protein
MPCLEHVVSRSRCKAMLDFNSLFTEHATKRRQPIHLLRLVEPDL